MSKALAFSNTYTLFFSLNNGSLKGIQISSPVIISVSLFGSISPISKRIFLHKLVNSPSTLLMGKWHPPATIFPNFQFISNYIMKSSRWNAFTRANSSTVIWGLSSTFQRISGVPASDGGFWNAIRFSSCKPSFTKSLHTLLHCGIR